MIKVVHKNKETYDVYIGRPSKWGNPFTHIESTKAEFKVATRDEAIDKYEEWITKGNGQYLLNDLHELRNKILSCWCKPKRCHGDVLKKLVEKKYPNTKNLF